MLFSDYLKAGAEQMRSLIPVIKWPYHIDRKLTIPACDIDLGPGEHYAGVIRNGESLSKAYHVVLLAGDACPKTYEAALEWATNSGGTLPTCREMLLLMANCRKEFHDCLYWTSDEEDAYLGKAFFPPANSESLEVKTDKLRVRAVAYYPVIDAENG